MTIRHDSPWVILWPLILPRPPETISPGCRFNDLFAGLTSRNSSFRESLKFRPGQSHSARTSRDSGIVGYLPNRHDGGRLCGPWYSTFRRPTSRRARAPAGTALQVPAQQWYFDELYDLIWCAAPPRSGSCSAGVLWKAGDASPSPAWALMRPLGRACLSPRNVVRLQEPATFYHYGALRLGDSDRHAGLSPGSWSAESH